MSNFVLIGSFFSWVCWQDFRGESLCGWLWFHVSVQARLIYNAIEHNNLWYRASGEKLRAHSTRFFFFGATTSMHCMYKRKRTFYCQQWIDMWTRYEGEEELCTHLSLSNKTIIIFYILKYLWISFDLGPVPCLWHGAIFCLCCFYVDLFRDHSTIEREKTSCAKIFKKV